MKKNSEENKKRIASLIKQVLILLGEDVTREGLRKTPERVAEVLEYITSGNRISLKEATNDALFIQKGKDMVVVKNIEMYSTCEHHLLPFFGKCHVAYIPKGEILGVSKIGRIIDMYAQRLQVQERLTDQISQALMETIKPMGVGVIIEAQHLCMMMRGIEKQQSNMITSSMKGVFQSTNTPREEFFSLICNRS